LPPGKPLHQLSQPRNRFSRLYYQVDVVRHQTESVHLDAIEIFELFERSQVVLKIGFLGKHHLLVVSSLHDVMRIIGKHYSSKSRHRSAYALHLN
jgi:hypothetical protein